MQIPTGRLLASRAALEVVCVRRDGRSAPPAHEVIDALRKLQFPPGRCFVWSPASRGRARDPRLSPGRAWPRQVNGSKPPGTVCLACTKIPRDDAALIPRLESVVVHRRGPAAVPGGFDPFLVEANARPGDSRGSARAARDSPATQTKHRPGGKLQLAQGIDDFVRGRRAAPSRRTQTTSKAAGSRAPAGRNLHRFRSRPAFEPRPTTPRAAG